MFSEEISNTIVETLILNDYEYDDLSGVNKVFLIWIYLKILKD